MPVFCVNSTIPAISLSHSGISSVTQCTSPTKIAELTLLAVRSRRLYGRADLYLGGISGVDDRRVWIVGICRPRGVWERVLQRRLDRLVEPHVDVVDQDKLNAVQVEHLLGI